MPFRETGEGNKRGGGAYRELSPMTRLKSADEGLSMIVKVISSQESAAAGRHPIE